MSMRLFHCARPEDTSALGARLGALAPPGTVVALTGDLGAGKTVFAQGVGKGLGVPSRVKSPTYVIVQCHDGGRLPFAHADLYRLGGVDELEQLGLDEVLKQGGVAVIEWATRFADALPADHLQVSIQDAAEGRDIQVSATGPASRVLLETL